MVCITSDVHLHDYHLILIEDTEIELTNTWRKKNWKIYQVGTFMFYTYFYNILHNIVFYAYNIFYLCMKYDY